MQVSKYIKTNKQTKNKQTNKTKQKKYNSVTIKWFKNEEERLWNTKQNLQLRLKDILK